MQRKKLFYYILMIVPFLITIIALFFMPDKIPGHYGSNNIVDRWGSKYETLILPVMTICFGFIFIGISKIATNDNKDSENENIVVIIGIIFMAIFNVLTIYFLYTSYSQITDLSQVPIDLYSLLFVIMGIGFIIMGIMMPKLKRNSVVGLRTSWSMMNDDTWKKSQYFGGISMITAGVLMISGCLFLFRGIKAIIFTLVLIGVMVIVDVIYSYIVAKKHMNN